MENDECPVCIDSFNKAKRKEIKCSYCDFKACKTCCETYLLQVSESHCMKCKKGWLYEFLIKNFGATFVTTKLRKHRKEILVQLEKAKIPETMPIFEREKKRKTKIKLETRKKNIISNIARTRTPLDMDIYREFNQILVNLAEIDTTVHSTTQTNIDQSVFIVACPVSECRGMLSTQWKCAVCDVYVCKNCRCVKNSRNDETHVCKKEDVDTIKFLMQDSKPCPKCACLIHRYQGCPQMWCTQCHTAFDWNTQKIVKGQVHNPHYYEFMQRNGTRTAAVDAPLCANLDGLNIFGYKGKHSTDIKNIHRLLVHIRDVEIPKTNTNTNDDPNLDLRIRFLDGEITEESWKKTLVTRERKLLKNTEFNNILDMFSQTCTDYLRRILNSPQLATSLLAEIKELVSYANKNLSNIRSLYKCTFPLIDPSEWCMEKSGKPEKTPSTRYRRQTTIANRNNLDDDDFDDVDD